ncbi:hypothetical protein P153DRAFT_69010 [Dothidotthia symphoricarpi CBS 119687]|uniref:Uncharacterized protein n=1 Tax=Dothidotthia symphoricarpi CBS 119687 TaxID=1392245 RepID=A0A6A6A6Q2_9PLEO|nr:uncharacterized protein P153DRAFT_69010 [Dothidotthia symphoricarpi CBS 119687]KAF2126744.1 hypothetical protein P153DRAFT_69010 [Dothidotthia symphoricarpi CBS 119687]
MCRTPWIWTLTCLSTYESYVRGEEAEDESAQVFVWTRRGNSDSCPYITAYRDIRPLVVFFSGIRSAENAVTFAENSTP